jgi:mannosyltransferase OCH1-like enzyme
VIPALTHQTAASSNLPEWGRRLRQKVVDLHPHWEHRFYDDAACRMLVAAEMPSLLPIYDAYATGVQRADLFRVAAVYVSGGFYLDVDVDVHRPFDSLRNEHLVLAEETTLAPGQAARLGNVQRQRIANYMFGSEPRHPFWLDLLEEMLRRATRPIARDEDILESTGPGLLTDVYHAAKQHYPDLVLVCNEGLVCRRCGGIACQFGEFASHLHVGSWRGV